jgi:hypothetical protein
MKAENELAFPVWAFVTAWRCKPARILLQRPYGHVFTLADRHSKRNPIWRFVSQFCASPITMPMRPLAVPVGFVRHFWDRLRDGPTLVWNTNDHRRFTKRFEDRAGLNLEMTHTQRKTIMVRTPDD